MRRGCGMNRGCVTFVRRTGCHAKLGFGRDGRRRGRFVGCGNVAMARMRRARLSEGDESAGGKDEELVAGN